jgi:hypothetical protein
LKHRTFISASALFTIFAAGAVTAMANDSFSDTVTPVGPSTIAITPVGPSTASITQLNYDEGGATVNGFLIGTNILLKFSKPVCGGLTTLGAVGNSVTYSGMALTLPSGFQLVNVSNFTNGPLTYPPTATPAKPSKYPLTPGTIAQLNYNPDTGSIDGFVFNPTSGPEVFVYIGSANPTLAPLLTVGASVSVVGLMEAPAACAPAGAIAEVDASSLTIGAKTYPIRGIL